MKYRTCITSVEPYMEALVNVACFYIGVTGFTYCYDNTQKITTATTEVVCNKLK